MQDFAKARQGMAAATGGANGVKAADPVSFGTRAEPGTFMEETGACHNESPD